MRDLRRSDVNILTLGQYLRPSASHLPVARYYTPEEFAELKDIGLSLGFSHVESSPLTRSSYHAWEQVTSAKSGGHPERSEGPLRSARPERSERSTPANGSGHPELSEGSLSSRTEQSSG
jgi:hypothetical protein